MYTSASAAHVASSVATSGSPEMLAALRLRFAAGSASAFLGCFPNSIASSSCSNRVHRLMTHLQWLWRDVKDSACYMCDGSGADGRSSARVPLIVPLCALRHLYEPEDRPCSSHSCSGSPSSYMRILEPTS